MKKFIPVIIILILLGIGGYFFLSQKSTLTQTGQQTGETTQPKQQGGSVISSIKDAILKSMSIKCEYPDNKGNKVISYVKGDKIRVMGYTTGETDQGSMLIRDNKMYIWDDKTKKGNIISLEKKTPTGTIGLTQTPDQKSETIENLEKYKDYCKAEAVADSIFAVPSDVQFTDYDQIMKDSGVDINKIMEQYKTSPPPTE